MPSPRLKRAWQESSCLPYPQPQEQSSAQWRPRSIPCVAALAETALTAQAGADCIRAQKLLPGLL